MTDNSHSLLPPDDLTRQLVYTDPDNRALRHVAVVGDTYTYLVEGRQTNGRYALIDMLIPAGGGPPPHRHDFEEMFHVLDGTVEVTLRGETTTATQGTTVNIPANAPHSFRNPTDTSLRLLCMVSPAGLERYFLEFGDEVDSRVSPAPRLSPDKQQERMQKANTAAARYRIENL